MNSQMQVEQTVYCVQCGMPLSEQAVECFNCQQPQPVPGAVQPSSPLRRHSQQAFNIGVPSPWEVAERNTMGLQFIQIDRPDARAEGIAGRIQQALSTSPASLQIFLFPLPFGTDVNMLNQIYTNMLSQKMAQRGGGMAGSMQLMAQPTQQQSIAFGDHPGLVLDFEQSFFGFGKTIERRFLTLTQLPQGVLGSVMVTQAPAKEFARWEEDLWRIASSFRFGPSQEAKSDGDTVNHLPPLRVPDVDSALGWAWLVDLGQGNLATAREAAREALSRQRSADTLFARAVVHQLQGNFKAAFPLFEDAFNATLDPGRQFIIAAIARLAERQQADILPDGFSLALPEAVQRFGEWATVTEWEQRWKAINEQLTAPYAKLSGKFIHDGVADMPALRSLTAGEAKGIPVVDLLPQLQQYLEQLGLEAGQRSTLLVELSTLISQLELQSLAGPIQATLEEFDRRIDYCQQTSTFLAAAQFAILQGDLLVSPTPLGHPNLLGYRLSDSDTQVTISADRTRFDRSAIDVAGAHSAYQIAWQNFDKAGAPRGKAMVRLRLAYLNAVEAINHQDRAKWTAAARDYQEAKHHFTLLGDQVNSWAAAFGEIWGRLHLGEPKNQLIAEVTTLAEDLKEKDALAWGLSWGLVLAYAGREALALWGDVELALRAADLAETVFGVFDTLRRQAQTCGDRADALQRLESVEESLVEVETALDLLKQAIDHSEIEALSGSAIGIQMTGNLMEIYGGQFDADGIKRTQDWTKTFKTFLKGIDNVTVEEVEEAQKLIQMVPGLMAHLPTMTAEEFQAKVEKINSAKLKINIFSLHKAANMIEEQAVLYRSISLGLNKMKIGCEEQAASDFQTALEIANSCRNRDLQRGIIFTAWRKPGKAIAALQQYLEAGLPQITDTLQPTLTAVATADNPALAAEETDLHQIRAHLPVVELFIKNKAWPEAREQLTVIERVSGPLKPLDPVPTLAAIRDYFYYGVVAAGHREYYAALGYLHKAVNGLEARRRALRQESLRRNFGGQYTTLQVYAEYARLLAETGQWPEAFAIADLIRARVLAESLAGARTVQQELGSNEVYRRYMEQRAIVERLTNQLNVMRQTDSPNLTGANKLRKDLESAITSLDRCEAELHHACPRWRELSAPQTEPVSLSEVAEKLPSRTLLLAYLFYGDSLLAWAVTNEGLVGQSTADVFHDEDFNASIFASQIETWREQVSGESEDVDLSTALAQVLLEPFDSLIAQAKHLLIVPYAQLNMLPFQALPWRDQPLGWQKSVSYLPAASMLQHFRPSDPTASGALVVGDPERMARLDMDKGKLVPLLPLPSARIAARLVADQYNVQPLIGTAATERAVRAAIERGPRIIHLATHGYFVPGSPLASGIALALDKTLSDEALLKLLKADQWQGSLSVDELMGLDIKADVVVLSACDTGRGKLQGSELVGLARGLLYAGAKAVVVSLWPVDDIAATIFMQLLHHIKLSTGKPFAQVLWQAEHQLRQITAPKLRKFCAVAINNAGTNLLERAEFLRYLSEEMAAYKDFSQAADYCEQAVDTFNTAGYQQQAEALRSKLKTFKLQARSQKDYDPNHFLFNSSRHWAAFSIIGDWQI
ncbi:MAG: CHAT domain-containing protein [Gammaproteobacteria bacterium]|nr:CHAT domain-containing protein [Gammaproteobacteria bacterium]